MKLTVQKKLVSGFAAVAAVFAVASAFSVVELKAMNHSYSTLMNRGALVKYDTLQIQYLAEHQLSLLRDNYVSDSSDDKAKINADHQSIAELTNHVLTIKGIDPTVYKSLRLILEQDNKFTSQANSNLALAHVNMKLALQRANSTGLFNYGANIVTNTQVIVSRETTNLNNRTRVNSQQTQADLRLVLIISFLGVLFSLALGLFISRIISKPMIKMSSVADLIAKGELTVGFIDVKNRDEIGRLAQSLSAMAANLRSVIIHVRDMASHVASASEELTASVEATTQASQNIRETIAQVSAGAERASLTTEETSKSVAEMAAGIQEISASAQSVAESASNAKAVAANGFQSVENAVQQMHFAHSSVDNLNDSVRILGESSREIKEMASVMNDIASRTTMLSLNAHIEAARAGEAGRGFSVVAEAVRELAEQSTERAKQIVKLVDKVEQKISTTVLNTEEAGKQVASGLRLVNAAGTSFQEILHSVTDMSGQIVEVSAAVEEMAAGAEQMARTVDEVSATTRDSAVSTETISVAAEQQLVTMKQLAGASISLSGKAEELSQLVRKFHV